MGTYSNIALRRLDRSTNKIASSLPSQFPTIVLPPISSESSFAAYTNRSAQVSLPKPPKQSHPEEFRSVLDLQHSNKFFAKSRMNFVTVSQDEQIQRTLRERLKNGLNHLSPHVAIGSSAVLIDGRAQRLYVVKRNTDSFDFIYETKVSTGRKGFGRPVAAEHSGRKSAKTPDGLFRVYTTVSGVPGQVIKKGTPQRAVLRNPNSGKKAEMLTKAFMLEDVDPVEWHKSAQARGIGLHGTNRENRLGTKASDGCIRISNLDIMALDLVRKENTEKQQALYIFIDPRQKGR